MYEPETSWRTTDDNTLVYNLRETGMYRRGEPVSVNDVAVAIDARRLSDEDRAEVAAVIRAALNEHFRR